MKRQRHIKYFLGTAVLTTLLLLLAGCPSPMGILKQAGHSQAAAPSGGAATAVTSPGGSSSQTVSARITVKYVPGANFASVERSIPGTKVLQTTMNGIVYRTYTLNLGTSVSAVLNSLSQNPQVANSEKDVYYHLFNTTPNDPDYSSYQYAPQITNTEAAWDVTTGSPSITVAEIDTGINENHVDFGTPSSKFVAGYRWVAESGQTADTSITVGTNSDDVGHGTHVAGIIGAVGNNGKGIAGVAWGSKIMPLKVFNAAGGGASSDIAAAIVYAADNGANVINMSLGGPQYSFAMADAVEYALSKGVVVVASMGNDGIAKVNYPAAYNGVIAVASSNGRDEISSYSTRGSYVSIAAPGEDIYSLSNTDNNGYRYMSGTSMAAPFVSGAAALLLSAKSSLTPNDVRAIFDSTAHDIGPTGFDSSSGYGRIDVGAAVAAAAGTTASVGKVAISLTNSSTALSGVEVHLLDSSGTKVLQTARTADGSNGTVAGTATFQYVAPGSYMWSAGYGTQSYQSSGTFTVSANSTYTDSHNFTVSTVQYTIQTLPVTNNVDVGGGADIIVYDSNLNLVASDTGYISDSVGDDWYYATYTFIPGQTYYIDAQSSAFARVYYSIYAYSGAFNSSITSATAPTTLPATTKSEPDEAPSQATPLPVGTYLYSYFDYRENTTTNVDIDLYSFQAP